MGYDQIVTRWPGTAHAIVETGLPTLDTCETCRIPYPPKLEPLTEKPSFDWDWVQRGIQHLSAEQDLEPRPTQEYVDLVWELFLDCLARLYATLASIKGQGSFQQLGTLSEPQSSHRPPAQRNHAQQQARTALQAVHRLQSLARNEGNPAKLRNKLNTQQQAVSAALGITPSEWNSALQDPSSALPQWIIKLRNLRISDYRKTMREWLKRITQDARPTGALYRWLKGSAPHPSLTVSFGGTLWKGPAKFFAAVRKYWENIMCEAPQERQALHAFCQQQQVHHHIEHEIEALGALHQAIASMKTQAAAGLDMWPVTCVKALPNEGRKILLRLYSICEEEACWPSLTHEVRTHLIPKPQSSQEAHTILEPAALRPIAIISVWIRLWSKWRLVQLGPKVHTDLSHSLRGGIPGRTMYPNMLELLLECEEALLVPEGDPFLCLSVDASKCFDRIRPTQALKLAERHGLDPTDVEGDCELHSSASETFQLCYCSGSSGPHPNYNGLLQGDPMSVLLCNLCIQDWHRAVTQD